MPGPTLEQAKEAPPLGLYVHVPFCATTCDFCAFYQRVPTGAAVQSFLEGIEAEARLVGPPRPVATVFWGGGTPGLLAPRELERLARAVRAFAGDGIAEWTVELAPASVTADRLAVLREVGVTRLSLGVQSFHPELLEALGRLHTREQAYRAYDRIRAAGFGNVNLDLMFALPGQTEAAWQEDLGAAIALGSEHLSTYCLTFEEDTALWVKLAKGAVKLDVEREARFYAAAWERLAGAGLAQYEVSNFARPGRACRHNLNTWRMHEWIGLGPSAASQHDGWRGANVADLERWREGVGRGERLTENRLELTPELRAEDALIFGLRLNEGVDLAAWRGRCPRASWDEIDALFGRLASEGLARLEGPWVRLTDRGRLVADAVGAELVGRIATGSAGATPAGPRTPGGA